MPSDWTKSLEIVPLPSEADYHRAVTTINGDIELATTRPVEAVLKERIGRYAQGQTEVFNLGIQRVATLIDPIDRSLGRDKDSPVYHIMRSGAIAGAAIAQLVHMERVPFAKLLDTTRGSALRSNPEEEDMLQTLHELGADAVDYGEKGMALMGDRATDMVESWEDRHWRERPELREHYDKQRLYRIACGLVAIRGHRLHQAVLSKQQAEQRAENAKGLEELREMADKASEYDWDAAAAELFGTSS